MPAARQLCRGSSSVSPTPIITVCPVCGTKVKPGKHVRMLIEGVMHMRPVIPAHVRNEFGEAMQVKVQDRDRYPRGQDVRGGR